MENLMNAIGGLICLVIGFPLVIIIVLLPFAGPIYFLENKSCHSKWEQVGHTEYGFFTGCLVEYEGRLVPADKVWFDRVGEE